MAYSLAEANTRFTKVLTGIPTSALVEVFVLVQLLWGVLLFLPGAQSFRVYIRVLPYAASLALFAFYYGSRKQYRLPAASKLGVAALLLLVINLAHPETQLRAGAAQCVFQFSIMAPAFWAGKAVQGARFLNRLLWLVFVASAANAVMGLLQIYFPQYLMPPEFSALAQNMNSHMVEALSYEGAGGQKIIRPPGLSDMPGGAAVAGMMTAIMGLAFSTRREWRVWTRAACLGLAVVGMVTLYLTQVRTLFLMMAVAIVVLCALVIRRGQRREGLGLALAGLGAIVGSFAWAVAIGGQSVADRFFSISESGLVNSIYSNRGIFVEHTLTGLLSEYPLGAGVGRWGMMNLYFGETQAWDAPPIWVEIQMTGWLLDGGVLMWVFYGGAVASALAYAYRRAIISGDRQLVHAAQLILCLNVIIVGTSFAGPAFNTQLGIQFWFLAAALHGAATSREGRAPVRGVHRAALRIHHAGGWPEGGK